MWKVTWTGLSLAVLAAAGSTIGAQDHAPLKPVRVIKGHTDEIRAVAFSANGNLLATGGDDMSVRVWDVATGDRQALIKHTARVESLSFSPDGKVVIAGDRAGEVTGWDVGTQETKLSLKVSKNSSVSFLRVAPDGETLATVDYDSTEAKLWDLSQGRLRATLKGHSGLVRALTFSPDSRMVATASRDGSARLWDGVSGKELDSLKAHAGPVDSLAYSSDGRQLLTGGADGTVRRWDLKTGNVIKPVLAGRSKKHRDVICVQPSASGKIVSVTWGDAIDVWDPNQENPLQHVKGFQGDIGSSGIFYYDYLALSPNGTILVIARDTDVQVFELSKLTGEKD